MLSPQGPRRAARPPPAYHPAAGLRIPDALACGYARTRRRTQDPRTPGPRVPVLRVIGALAMNPTTYRGEPLEGHRG
jgi:hypothetical protein